MTRLLEHQVLLVTGKGGVGKSVVAAALARYGAARGRRVLLVEFEEVSRAAPLFGIDEVSPEPTPVADRLALMGFDLMHSLRAFALDQLKVKALVDLALRNDSVRGFFLAMPAIKSILFLYRLHQLTHRASEFDLIVCDLPTSGFVAGLYGVPAMLGQIFRVGPLATTVEQMGSLLRDRGRAGLVLVTLAEEMPVVETVELARDLRSTHGVEAARVFINGVFATEFSFAQWERVEAHLGATESEDVRAMLEAAGVVHRRAERAQSQIRHLTQQLHHTPVVLSHRFRRELTLDDVDHLAAEIDRGEAAHDL